MKALLFIIISIMANQVATSGSDCYADTDPPLCNTCGGSCDAENGCNCADGLTTCVPTDCVMGSNACCDMLTGWYYDPTKSCCTQTFQCSPSCTIDEYCLDVNGNGECVCNTTYYKGLVVGNLKPSVNCSGGTMTTSFSKCELVALGYNFSTVHLFNNSAECVYAYEDIQNTKRMDNVQVKAAIGWCGNIVVNDSSTITFTNNLHINANSGPLIFKNPISYNFTCTYNRTMQAALSFALHPVTSTITIPSASGTGTFSVTLAAYTDEECLVPLQESDTVIVGSDLFLGIFSPDLNGNALALRVEKCFATPTNNTDYTPNVLLVDGGCAVDGDVPTTILENGDSAEARIRIGTFLFQGYGEVYIFCIVQICNKTEDCKKCDASRSANTVYQGLGIKVNVEDLSYMGYSSSGHVTGVSWAVLASSLMAYFYVKS